jgi:hypothetical protein
MSERQSFFIPNSTLDIMQRVIFAFSRFDESDESTMGMQEIKSSLNQRGAILLDAHISRGRKLDPQAADIGVSLLHLLDNVGVKQVHLAAAGDFYHHPMVYPWITRYSPEGNQSLKIYDVYSKRREMLIGSRSSKKMDEQAMHQRNDHYHQQMYSAMATPGNLIVYNPFAGPKKLGAGSVPERVARMLKRQAPILLSATWLTKRGFISGFNDSLLSFDASFDAKEIGDSLNFDFLKIVRRIRS